MPRASAITAVRVNPGFFTSERNPYRMSCRNVSSAKPVRPARTSSFTCSTPPTCILAVRRASSSFIPCFIFFSVRSSTYEPTSSLRSRSIRCLRIVLRIRLPLLERRLIRGSGRSESAPDGYRDSLPVFRLRLELTAPGPGEAVEFCPPIVFGFAPLGFQPARFLHPVEGWKEGARFYVESSLGDLVDPRGNTE